MFFFVTFVVGGVELGITLALIGIGLVLCFRATQTFNFAHGQFMYLGAILVALWEGAGSGSSVLAIFASALTVAMVGALLYVLVLRRTVGAPDFIPVIATLGVGLIIDGILEIIVGPNEYVVSIPWLPKGSIEIFGAYTGVQGIILAGFGVALALLVILLVQRTSFGLKLRAAGQGPLLSSQGGIRIHWVYLISWGIAGALAAIAGISYSTTSAVSPNIESLALAAFPAIILGGFDSIGGALLGGLAIGFIESAVSTYWVPTYVDVVTYIVLLIVMAIRPQGFFGTKGAIRV